MKALRLEVVAYQDDLKEHFLVNLHELLIPLVDVGSLLAVVGIVIGGRGRVGLVVLAPFDDFLQDNLADLRW